MFKEILKASRNNQASIFAFTFKFKLLDIYYIYVFILYFIYGQFHVNVPQGIFMK